MFKNSVYHLLLDVLEAFFSNADTAFYKIFIKSLKTK